MKSLLASLTLLLTAPTALPSPAAGEEKPKVEMGMMSMVLLTQPAEAKAVLAKPAVFRAQREQTDALLKSGKVLFVGRSPTNAGVREVLVLKSADTNEAITLAASLPAVKSGAWTAENLRWYGPANLFKPAAGNGSSRYVFGMLVRGANAAKIPAEESKQIQAGHMANIRRLGELGKLVIAGPFEQGGDRRGIFIFKVDSLAEAQKLADTDPAVIAGRLKIELWSVEVPAGILP